MASRSDKHKEDALWSLTKRIAELERKIDAQTPLVIREQLDRLDLLLVQLNRHVNPTRDEVQLLKRTNRELAKELQQVHELLNKEH